MLLVILICRRSLSKHHCRIDLSKIILSTEQLGPKWDSPQVSQETNLLNRSRRNGSFYLSFTIPTADFVSGESCPNLATYREFHWIQSFRALSTSVILLRRYKLELSR